MITKPNQNEYHPDFGEYIALVPEGNILELLAQQMQKVLTLFQSLPEERANYRYTPGKWTVKEVLGHVLDSERVFAYRALAIARGDQQDLPGFEQDDYAAVAGYDRVPMENVVRQYELVRRANIAMFNQFPDNVWTHLGKANGNPISVRAIAYIIAGHELHHLRVLNERYGIQ